MKNLYNRHVAPPGGYRYFVPETKVMLKTGGGFTDLLKEIGANYKANGMGVPVDIEELVEDYICSELPGGWCTEGGFEVTGEYSDDGSTALDFSRMVDGTITLARWMLGGKKLVSLELAEARGAVCVGCRFNQPAQGCTSCNRGVVDRAVEAVVGGARTSQWDQLHACGVCGCGLRSLVHIPIDILNKGMSEAKKAKFPDWCWKKTEKE